MASINIPPIGPIEWAERPGSPQEGYTGQQGKVHRVFDVSWSQRWNFCYSMLGWSTLKYSTPDGAGNSWVYISRQPPQSYQPLSKDPATGNDLGPWLYATGVDRIEGVGVDRDPSGRVTTLIDENDVFHYDTARITISYETLSYRVLSDTDLFSVKLVDQTTVSGYQAYGPPGGTVLIPDEGRLLRNVSRHVQPAAEHLTLPIGKMKWASDGQASINGVGKLIATKELQFTWHGVPFVPNAAYSSLGKVNNDVFVDRTAGAFAPQSYDPWTLLLVGLDIKPYRHIGGTYLVDVIYRMKHLENRTKFASSPGTANPRKAGKPYGHRGLLRYFIDGARVPNGPKDFNNQPVDNYYDYDIVNAAGKPGNYLSADVVDITGRVTTVGGDNQVGYLYDSVSFLDLFRYQSLPRTNVPASDFSAVTNPLA